MKKTVIYKIISLLALFVFFTSCTEPYALQTNTFEEALVVEATITNELKHQEIKISKTYRLEENGPTPQTGATVYISDSNGNQYNFEENNGVYVSETEFQAVSGTNYFLNITTSDGKSYISTPETLTTTTPLESITATSTTNTEGISGVKIAANSYDPTNTSKYYRYKYEETFKIISPKWVSQEVIFNTISNQFEVVGKTFLDTQVCYSSENSSKIILTNTNELSEDRVNDFEVLFLDKTNYKIAHRYSVLVKQYVENLASYSYFKTLQQISGNGGSILSQNQPGFFYGNIKSVDNPSEKVIGFFDVASFSSKRIFIDFTDVYPGQVAPVNFPYACEEFTYNSADMTIPGGEFYTLKNNIQNNILIYYSNAGPIYKMVIPYCGDCTKISSNVIPPFWQ